ncbi:MAG TPA: response regulator [Anaerolineae bacterium]|nr:response regulator [Anaerolineae bacterium]
MSTRLRILIVDDEESVLFVWRNALQKLTNRVRVETVQNGDEALYKIEQAPFDLLVTDLRMPGLTGQALTQAVRKLRPDLLVIWITAFRSPEIDVEAERLGVLCCLDKPLTVAQIRQVVPQVLEVADRHLPIGSVG